MKRKHVVYNSIGASLSLTAAIVALSGVDLGALALDQLDQTANLTVRAATFPVTLPVWAIALLCTPTIWFLAAIGRAVGERLQDIGARNTKQERAYPIASPLAVPEDTPAVVADAEGDRASEHEHAHATQPVAREGYFEDALFGVLWRWEGEPSGGELAAHCAACDESLTPWANGGSLSRGLHCERCNKLRAAGEHPDEVFEKVARTLGERKQSGEWRSAPRRVDAARSAATRPLASLPAA